MCHLSTKVFCATVTSNGSPYATVPLSCLSCLSFCNVGVLWPNGWMDQDATCYDGSPRPRQHCVRWGPSSPTERGTAAAPCTYRPKSNLTKRSPTSAAAELLFFSGANGGRKLRFNELTQVHLKTGRETGVCVFSMTIAVLYLHSVAI